MKTTPTINLTELKSLYAEIFKDDSRDTKRKQLNTLNGDLKELNYQIDHFEKGFETKTFVWYLGEQYTRKHLNETKTELCYLKHIIEEVKNETFNNEVETVQEEQSPVNIFTNKNGNLELHFISNINIDNGVTNTSIGVRKSEMELFTDEEGTPTQIEWIVEDENDEIVEHIGLFFEGKELQDYDGVFEIPKEAIQLVRHTGYSVPNHFED